MTETPGEEYPELYREGVRLFNEQEFFACHDTLEELWTDTSGPERAFYQGLIQASVALFHFGEGNLGGARKMYESARGYLRPYQPRFQGLDVERFLADLRHCFQDLLAAPAGSYPAHVRLEPQRIPRIELRAHSETGPGAADHV
jgi:predicted metal-dependent hydrolase